MGVSTLRHLPDYASRESTIHRNVKVGISGINLYRTDFNDRNVLTRQSAYINLVRDQGAHMSRLVEALMSRSDDKINLDNQLLEDIATSHDIGNAYWDCHFKSIFSGDQPFLVDCTLEGVASEPELYVKYKEGDALEFKWALTVNVPYASVCPCSNEMVKEVKRGVPHMQRCNMKVTGLVPENGDLDWLISAEISKIVKVVKLIPEPLMKRPDELAWCKRAQKVNLFVEDAARQVAEAIDGFYNDFVVVAEHQESIHEHNVIAVYRKGNVLL